MRTVEIIKAFEHIVGIDSICAVEQSDLQPQIERSLSLLSNKVSHVIYPNSQVELSAAIALAHKHRIQILPCGNGSKLDWGGLASISEEFGVVISTARLDRLIEHAVGDLTVTCEAGMKFAALQEILAKEGQFLAIDPAYPSQATMGGILATGNTGSLRQRYGGVRDMVLGISLVRADGVQVKAGGRVVKNVAGYDLMKLVTGSFGSLGIISQLTFRVYPLPECDRTIFLTGLAASIDQARQRILNSSLTPLTMDIISSNLVAKLGKGLALGLVVRFGGIPKGVQEQAKRLSEMGEELNLKAELIGCQEIADLYEHSDRFPLALVCKIGILPAQIVATLGEIEKVMPNCQIQVHAASGLAILSSNLSENLNDSIKSIESVRNLVHKTGGFLTILQAPTQLKQQMDVWGYRGNALAVMTDLKHQFDLHNLLNPSRLINF